MSQVFTAYTTYIAPTTPRPPLPAEAESPPVARAVSWPEDRFDFSGMTVREAIAKLDELRLEEIRRQIRDGTYFTEDKLNVVVDRLRDVIRMDVPKPRSA